MLPRTRCGGTCRPRPTERANPADPTTTRVAATRSPAAASPEPVRWQAPDHPSLDLTMCIRRSRPRRAALLGSLLLLIAGAAPGPTQAALPPQAAGVHPIPCTAELEPNEAPDQAPMLASEVCLSGTLPELRDQDLVLWDVTPADALTTWRFTVEGIPETITSIWVYDITSEDGVYPPQTTSLFRVDSDATSATPGLRKGVALPAGRYLLGISRGNPADG